MALVHLDLYMGKKTTECFLIYTDRESADPGTNTPILSSVNEPMRFCYIVIGLIVIMPYFKKKHNCEVISLKCVKGGFLEIFRPFLGFHAKKALESKWGFYCSN